MTIQKSELFNLESGIIVQKSQLKTWSYILNDLAYNELSNKCEEMNEKLRAEVCNDGYKVFRGSDMDNFIKNFAITLRNNDF